MCVMFPIKEKNYRNKWQSCTQKRKQIEKFKNGRIYFTKLATDIPLSNLGVQKVHGKFTEGPR